MKKDNDFLTKEKVSRILSKSGLNMLLSSFLLNIKKRKNVVIVCPVGKIDELKNFVKYLRNAGLDKSADAVFIYKKGLHFAQLNINALHIKEKIPLGTSGAFFAATYLGYSLGYEIIVVADINVFIDSKKSFVECVDLAKKENKAVFPVCTAPEDENPDKALSYNVNGFTFYPRKVFEIVGFHIPYTWRGGEDFELLMRLMEAGLVCINKNAFVSHPRAGYTIFHKMAEKRKFYPYVSGIMKAFLFHSDYDIFATLKFIFWYMFYSFFADIFSDAELLKTLKKTSYLFAYLPSKAKEDKFEIKRVKESGLYPYSSFLRFLTTPLLLISLLLSKKAEVYTDQISLKTSRWNIFFGLLKAVIFIPLRFLQACSALLSWRKTKKGVVYPVKPENAKKAIEIFTLLIKNSGLS